MSSRRLGLIVAALLAARSVALHAQAPSADIDSLLRRVHQLDSVMLARGRTVDSIRRSLVRSVPPVEIQRGPLHVRTDSTLARPTREAVDSVAALIAARGGNAVAERASTSLPTITRDSTRSVFGMIPVLSLAADTGRRRSLMGQRQIPANATPRELTDALTLLVEQVSMQGVDSALFAWVMLGRAPLRSATNAELADVYIELATTPSVALRRCRAKEISACLDALGVDSMPGSRLTRWYALEDYRSVTRAAAPPSDDSIAVAGWIRCREDSDESGCRLAATALPDARVPLPLSASARTTFLREVLDAGGPGAFDRLVSSKGPISQRLAFAANEPLDRTVARWLGRVERARPERMRIPGTLIVASLGWTAAILGLALTRRTTWA